MDGDRFDRLTRLFAGPRTRRSALKTLAGGLAAGIAGVFGAGDADAAKCRTPGEICRKGADCCSNTCGSADARGRRRCQCRTTGDCPVPANGCKSAVCTNGTCSLVAACAQGQICSQNGCCTPTPKETFCAGKCGIVNNNCGRRVDCGPCCTANGGNCASNGACCSGACIGGTWPPKAGSGGTCDDSGDCQNGLRCCSGQCHQCCGDGDCPTYPNECGVNHCVTGNCAPSYVANNTPTSSQTTGDCKQNVCSGSGQVVSVNDDGDTPADDGNQCTSDICVSGSPSHPNKSLGAACSQNGGSVCDGSGHCVECNGNGDCSGGTPYCSANHCVQCLDASQCPGTDTECQTRTCLNHLCGFSFAPNGTPLTSQTAGDCHKDVCNGAGSPISIIDNSDLRVDGNQCTSDICTSGTPSNPAKSLGFPCNQNGGSVCDGVGQCVQCNTAGDCGTNTACRTYSCTSGTCGFTDAPAGTVVANLTVGDCHSDQCDGNGNVTTNAVDNTDVPADDGKSCTTEICSAGTPLHQNKAAGSTCSQDGGIVCDGAGNCVECNSASDCGTNTECRTHTCTNNVCGFSDAAYGTPLGSQTTGDCQTAVCDGSGGTTSVTDSNDAPAEGGCMTAYCDGSTPVITNADAGQTCDTGVCDGAGNCVQCLQDGDCSGGTPFCELGSHTCVECLAPSDCFGASSIATCSTIACNNYTCGYDYAPDGTFIGDFTPGDCQATFCDGNGNEVDRAYDSDTPTDAAECSENACDNGSPSYPYSDSGKLCSTGVCDGYGSCVECVQTGDCGSDWICCSDNVCHDPTAYDTCGDCDTYCSGAAPICDGNGTCVGCRDNNDCGAGTPYCDLDTHTCVECLQTGDCTETGTFCQPVVCSGGACVGNNTAYATPLPDEDQTAGDCLINICDGSGGITSVPDPSDRPSDAAECHINQCDNGRPSYPPAPAGSICNYLGSGSGVCDGTGSCVQCLEHSDCGDGYCEGTTCIPCGYAGLPCTITSQCCDTLICLNDTCTYP